MIDRSATSSSGLTYQTPELPVQIVASENEIQLHRTLAREILLGRDLGKFFAVHCNRTHDTCHHTTDMPRFLVSQKPSHFRRCTLEPSSVAQQVIGSCKKLVVSRIEISRHDLVCNPAVCGVISMLKIAQNRQLATQNDELAAGVGNVPTWTGDGLEKVVGRHPACKIVALHANPTKPGRGVTLSQHPK